MMKIVLSMAESTEKLKANENEIPLTATGTTDQANDFPQNISALIKSRERTQQRNFTKCSPELRDQ